MIVCNTEEVISKFIDVHGDKYCYDLVNYINAITKVKIICKTHDIVFEQTPNSHLNGSGCPKCGLVKVGLQRRLSTDEFIMKAKLKHGDMFIYDKVEYKTYYDRVIITCRKHGDFKQTPRKHLSGSTCRKCVNESYYIDFVGKCKEKYSGYTYDKVVYEGMYTKVIITCDIHGDFTKKPVSFLHKERLCPKCVNRTVSKNETKWLDEMKVPKKYRNYYIQLCGKMYCVDGIDLDNKIIYEYNGDFFHGNPNKYNKDDINPLVKEKFGNLYEKTINKEKHILESGFRLVSIWDSDYIKKNK